MMFTAVFAGAVAMASLTIALFFLRFWKTTHDRFFLFLRCRSCSKRSAVYCI